MTSFKIISKEIRDDCIKAVQACTSDKIMQVTIKEYKKNRTLAQNRLMHDWFNQRANQLFTDPIYEKSIFKLQIAAPILIAESEDFARVFNLVIENKTYLDQLEIIKYLPVTSLMNTKQLTKALETYERQSHGLGVTFKTDALYNEAMNK